jgi:hypothetical protein
MLREFVFVVWLLQALIAVCQDALKQIQSYEGTLGGDVDDAAPLDVVINAKDEKPTTVAK